MANPLYPIQVEGWPGVVRQTELCVTAPQTTLEALVESAYQETLCALRAHPTLAGALDEAA